MTSSEVEAYEPRYRPYVAFILAPDRTAQGAIGSTGGNYLPEAALYELQRRHAAPVFETLVRHGYRAESFDDLKAPPASFPDEVLNALIDAAFQVVPLATRQALYWSLAQRPPSVVVASRFLARVSQVPTERDRGELSEREVLLSVIEAHHAIVADITTLLRLFDDPDHADLSGFVGLILLKTKYDRKALAEAVAQKLRDNVDVGVMLALAVRLKAVAALPAIDVIAADNAHQHQREARATAKRLRK